MTFRRNTKNISNTNLRLNDRLSIMVVRKKTQANNWLSNFLLIKRSGNDEASNFSTVNRVNLDPSSGQPFPSYSLCAANLLCPPTIERRTKTFARLDRHKKRHNGVG